jgi:hypothetical protein
MKGWWQRRHEQHQDPVNSELEELKSIWKLGAKRRSARDDAPEIESEQTNIYSTPSGNKIPRRSRGKRTRPRHPS